MYDEEFAIEILEIEDDRKCPGKHLGMENLGGREMEDGRHSRGIFHSS